MDTLAGVAIKYGVEVADIRRMNGLVTDLQMFAHNSLQIPLPGRHPPSPLLSNGSTKNGYVDSSLAACAMSKDDVMDSLQTIKLKPKPRLVSPAMCSLQGYYGLRRPRKTLLLGDDTPASDPTHGRHRRTRSLVNEFLLENGDFTDDVGGSDRSIRRRQKADAGKGLALRPKSGSRMDVDAGSQNTTKDGDSIVDVLVSVRRSSSTSNLIESANSPSIWSPSMWSLKPDAIARPIFDGLPKPVTARRYKAALD
ncbi:hypothetical protein AXF42_Ash015855 [Apostasia shenzhenica]|uniref:LysM domain-containing protein n=1 Tax=Apostasia shenzhenica TaxID=1088818 RepID=A0A2H9ZXV0_9ASPA|nr:hypothetical protein AXF42_Ash015855 [Apostasia shenzhenica]